MANKRNGNFMYLIQEDNFSRTSMHASNHGIKAWFRATQPRKD